MFKQTQEFLYENYSMDFTAFGFSVAYPLVVLPAGHFRPPPPLLVLHSIK